jgi:RNA-directed DNA polymerase
MDEAAQDRMALAEMLGDAFLDGKWRAEELAERGSGCLELWPDWMARLAFAVVGRHRVAPVEDRDGLVRFIAEFLNASSVTPSGLRAPWAVPDPSARQPAAPQRWPIARIESVAALAEALELSSGQLAWLADVRGLERTVEAEKLRNYRYRWAPRRSGLPRLIEAPKARLKEIQRWVLHEILDRVPAHDAAHGFTPGRSVLTHASLHTGRAIVVRIDLRDFFASVSAGRVYGIFRTLGYPASVAHSLTGLCSNTIPSMVWNAIEPPQPHLIQARFWLGRQLATPHLPQGAPTSPALANLAAFALDRRLDGLGDAFTLTYSRYADDLVFSGPRLTDRGNRTLLEMVRRIVSDEGFRVNDDKTSLRTAAQRQLVTGVVVNAHANVSRPEYDRLKAILHRIAVDGPASYDPRGAVDLQAHLRGRVAWVGALNPHRGEKLRRLLDAIDWTPRNRPGP